MLNNRYDIIRSLGKGGWGEVSLAVDTATGRQVAVKRMPLDGGLDPRQIDNEIVALAKLDHPGIVSYVESFERDGSVYVVMEYVDGSTLEERVSQGAMPLADIERYTLQILEALEHVHTRGIIHSDLKPANIIIDREDNIRLIDFGIIRTASAEIAADIKEVRGTLHYMSPEQAEGRPYDIRSDLFSLGVILYELTTGRKPFVGDYDMAVIYSILYEEPIPPEKINTDISSGLSQGLLRLLAKIPSDRPGSAAEVRKLLSGVFIPAARPAEAGANSIALLPLEFPADDNDSKLIAEGLKDELYARLKQLAGVSVVSPVRVAQQAGNLSDGRAIRNLLGADCYLMGSVRQMAGRLRIYTMLLSSTDDAVLWSDKYDSPISDLFDVIDTITEKVMDGLKVTLTGAPTAKTPISTTTNPEAYELYLLARSYYVKNTAQDTLYARAMYQEALKLDPDYALALVGLADCCCQDYMNFANREKSVLDESEDNAKKALEIVAHLPEAYRSLGRIKQFTGNLKEASQYYLKAVTYKEDYYQAYRSLGWLAKDCFKYDEALAWVRKSLSINSTDVESIYLKGVIHFEKKESKQAMNDFTRCLELRPDYGRAYFCMGMTYYQLGRVDQAITCMDKAIRFGGDINAPYLLAYYHAVRGDYERGRELLHEASKIPGIGFLVEYHRGVLDVLTDACGAAREHFEQSSSLCRQILADDPDFTVAKIILLRDLAFLGRPDECQPIIKEVIPFMTYDGSLALDIAIAYSILGEQDQAGKYLALALDIPQGPTQAEIDLDPILSRFYHKDAPK